MPTLYNYYNHTDSSYTFSIINKSLGTRKTYVKIGDDNTQIYTESSGNFNIKANTLTIGDTSTDSTIINGSLTVGDSHLFVKSIEGIGYTGINNDNPTKNLDIIGDTRITDGDFIINDNNEETLLSVNKETGHVNIKEDVFINTNKFTITASTGDTDIAGNLEVTGDLSVTGAFLGRVPLGGVIPVLPIFFAFNNSGTKTYNAFPSSGEITIDGFQLCDGLLVNTQANPSFVGKYVPNLTDSRFIQGSIISEIGGIGGGSTSLIESNLPSHTHSISHSHTIDHGHTVTHDAMKKANFGGVIEGGNYSPPTLESATITVNNYTGSSGVYSGSTGAGAGTGTPFNVVPKFINAVYLIRVK